MYVLVFGGGFSNDVPDPPTDVQLVICDGRVAQLQWELPAENNSPVRQFIIQTNSSFKPDVWETLKSQLPRNRTHQRVTLSPWGNYTFRILAENAVGLSKPSMVTKEICTTEAEVPRMNPQGVCSVNHSPNTLLIKWQPIPLEEQNGPGFKYQVSWMRYDSKDSIQESTVNASTNTLLVSGVFIFTLYDVHVTSINEMGPAMSPQKSYLLYSSEAG
ncbi:hypothetical protein HELRODRAFT_161776 [Helobdella robusta]|uniref:Fibronectin type-III domain-containing protein n=1 Tax=Helobdella robusta TaxID=6412 RepID=T1ERW5_HELRO|nr:hypothetical protein HELRODRAFT_161776 [Helobdella robusta]ESO02499.1 hypothetical protein HELRODRAFT_161776 [Helobdella robusta]